MRKWIILGVFAAVAAGLCGCATVAKTGDENLYTYRQIAELDTRQMADDWNLFWLADRQSRLTRWVMR